MLGRLSSFFALTMALRSSIRTRTRSRALRWLHRWVANVVVVLVRDHRGHKLRLALTVCFTGDWVFALGICGPLGDIAYQENFKKFCCICIRLNFFLVCLHSFHLNPAVCLPFKVSSSVRVHGVSQFGHLRVTSTSGRTSVTCCGFGSLMNPPSTYVCLAHFLDYLAGLRSLLHTHTT